MKTMILLLAMALFGRLVAQHTIDGDFYPSYDGTLMIGAGIRSFPDAVLVDDEAYNVKAQTRKELLGIRTYLPVTLITEGGKVVAYSLWFKETDWIPMFAKLVDRYGIQDEIKDGDDGLPLIHWFGYKVDLSLMVLARTQFSVSVILR